jgi:hypothetical protein
MADSPNVIWVDVSKLNFSNGQPVMSLDPKSPALVGDVSRGFQQATNKRSRVLWFGFWFEARTTKLRFIRLTAAN